MMKNKKNIVSYAVLVVLIALSGFISFGLDWNVILCIVSGVVCYLYLGKYPYSSWIKLLGAYIYGMAGVHGTAGQLEVYRFLPLTIVLLLISIDMTLQKTRYGLLAVVAVLLLGLQGEVGMLLAVIIGICYAAYQLVFLEAESRKKWGAIIVLALGFVSGILLSSPIWWKEWSFRAATSLSNVYQSEMPMALSGLRQIKTLLLRLLSNNLQGSAQNWKGHGDFSTVFPVFLSVLLVLCLIQYLYKIGWKDRNSGKLLQHIIPFIAFGMLCMVYFNAGTYIIASQVMTGLLIAFLPYFVSLICHTLNGLMEQHVWGSWCNLAITFGCIIFCIVYGNKSDSDFGLATVVISVVLLLACSLVLECLYRLKRDKIRQILTLVLFLLVAVNLCTDNWISMNNDSRDGKADNKSYEQILQEIENEEGDNVYRIANLTDVQLENGNLAEFGTNSLTEGLVAYCEEMGNQGYFESLQNGISYKNHNMGMYFDTSAAQQMGVKYVITDKARECEGWTLFASYGDYYAYRCDTVQSIASVYQSTIPEASFANYDSMERLAYTCDTVVLEQTSVATAYVNNNEFAERQEVLAYDDVACDNVELQKTESGVSGKSQKEGAIVLPFVANENRGNSIFDTYVSLEDRGRIWIDILNTSGDVCEKMEYYVDGQDEVSFKLPTDATALQITFETENEFKIEFPTIYEITEEHLAQPAIVKEVKHGYEADVNVEKKGIFYLAIPYDVRYEAYIDDNKCDILRANYGFMAVEVPEGSHTIKLINTQNEVLPYICVVVAGMAILAILAFCIHKHLEVKIADKLLHTKWKKAFDNKGGKIWVFFIFAASFILLLLQHRILNIFYDDYANAALCYGKTIEGANGTDFTMNQLVEWAKWCYMNWGGRILYAGLFLIPMLKNGATLYMVVQAFVITILIYIIYRMVCYFSGQKTSVPAAVVLWLLYGLIGRDIHVQGTYWASASILYVWPLVAVFWTLFAFMALVKRMKSGKPVNVGICLPAILIPAFFAGFSQEQTGLSLIVALILLIVFMEGKDWKNYQKLNCPVLLVSIISYVLEVAAPGNYVRLDTNEFAQLSFFEKIKTNVPLITDMFFENSFLWINLVLLLAMLLMSWQLFQKNKKHVLFLVLTIINVVGYIGMEKIGFCGTLTLLFELEFLLYLLVLCGFYFISSKRGECMAYVGAAVVSVYCLVISPAVQFRSYIEYMFIVFMIVAVVLSDVWNAVRKKAIWREVYILAGLAIALKAAMMFGTMYHGYVANSYSLAYNHEVLSSYNGTEKELILSKADNDVYRLQMPYDEGFEYIEIWLREYYDIPADVTIRWCEHIDYKNFTAEDLLAGQGYEKKGEIYENGWLGAYGDIIFSDEVKELTLLCSTKQGEEDMTLFIELDGRHYAYDIGQHMKKITIPVSELHSNRIHLVPEETYMAKGSKNAISVRVQVQVNR